MEDYKIYVAGKIIETVSPLEVVNPFTQKVFAKTFLAGKNEIEQD
jgi:hypothetical protein